MSAIYFHSKSNKTQVNGSERALMANIVNNLTLAILDISTFNVDKYKQIINPQHYLYDSYYQDKPLIESLKTAVKVADTMGKDVFQINNQNINTFNMSLNTAISIGNDVIKLFARLHGQCEIHAYVSNENKKWLADIIQQGLDSQLIRPNSGWEDTIKLLNNDDETDVVTSYSVCEQFPNREIAHWFPKIPMLTLQDEMNLNIQDEIQDQIEMQWYNLPKDTQWDLAIKGLKKKPNKLLELKPDNWDDVRFGTNPITAIDINKYVWEQK
jgi:hypothetical protein